MNLYIKLLFAIMILYTFYNFYMDFRGVINGGTFLEGNENMLDNEELTEKKVQDIEESKIKLVLEKYVKIGILNLHTNIKIHLKKNQILD